MIISEPEVPRFYLDEPNPGIGPNCPKSQQIIYNLINILFSEMKLILLFMVLLVSALMTSATMNVGTFWFAQNNGKFYPVRGSGNGYYDQISSRSDLEGGNGNNRLQEQEQEVRQLLSANWWYHFNFWNKMIRFKRAS